MTTPIQILHRRDTAANWASANPVLGASELGYETDTGRFKFGDGSTAWNALTYLEAGVGDVVGPATSTDNAIARFDAGTGKKIQNSLVTIDDSGSVNVPAGQDYKIDGQASKLTDDVAYYVNCDTGDDDNPGTVGSPFATIQHAIDVLPKNLGSYYASIILMDSVNYSEKVTIQGFYGGTVDVYAQNDIDDVVMTSGAEYFAFLVIRCTALIWIEWFTIGLTLGNAIGIVAQECDSLEFSDIAFSGPNGNTCKGIWLNRATAKIADCTDRAGYDPVHWGIDVSGGVAEWDNDEFGVIPTSGADGIILPWGGCIDADTVDGEHASAFADAAHTHSSVASIPLPASQGLSRATNGAAYTAPIETGTNHVCYVALDFDNATDEYACWVIPAPRDWNAGTVTFIVHWTSTGGSGTFCLAIKGGCLGDNVAIDTALGTAVAITDTFQNADRLHISPESDPMTFAGTPATAKWLVIEAMRDVSEDTLGQDARVIGLIMNYTRTAI